MKVKNIKKALSLFLAVLMIALALLQTMLPVAAEETTNTTATTIKYAKLFAKYSDGYDVHAQYGSVAAMIDGDPAPGYIDEDGQGDEDRTEYTYYQSDNLYDGIMYYYLDSEKKLTLDTDGNNEVYMGYAVFELNGLSAIEDVTVWLAGDNATEWKTPKTVWNMNDDYDILVSNDGETWNLLQSFTDMCGDGTNPGANFPAEGDDARAVGTDGKLGHKIALDGAEAKYFAIGVKSGMNSTNTTGARNAIVFGEVTVNGTVITPDATKKSPAEIYAEAKDGDLLKTVNFNDMSWSDDYANSDNWNTYAYVSEDGRTVKHLIHGSKTFGTNNKRAMWGGIAEEERFSLDNGNKYTIYFDALFGGNNNKYGVGIQVDGDNTLVIDGNGCSYWYNWNTQKVSGSQTWEDKWPAHGGTRGEKNSFAVEVDSSNETMTLYVADADGIYKEVRTLTYEAGTDSNGNPYPAADISGSLICRIYTRYISGTVDSTYWSEVSDVKIYKGLVAGQVQNVTGASVRLSDPTGIRFSSEFRKAMIDSLRATYGEENVNLGMIIAPTDYLTDTGVEFEMEALDACDELPEIRYVKVDAKTIHEDGAYYTINCALANVHESNYNRRFSARAFIEVNGEVYKYADFNLENNSRSIAEVAELAYGDLADAEGTVKNGLTYSNPVVVGDVTKYSPYTEDQRKILEGFFQ